MTDEERKAKRNASQRIYRAAHKDDPSYRKSAAESNKKYAATHKVKIAEYSVAYRAEYRVTNKEKILEQGRAWRAVHKEEIAAYNHTWHRKTKHKALSGESEIKHRLYYQQWEKRNRLKKNVSRAKHRAAKRVNTPVNELLTESQWREILREYDFHCAYCGTKLDKPTMDHVIPLSRGGKHTKGNIVPACSLCNSKKGTGSMQKMAGLAYLALDVETMHVAPVSECEDGPC